MGGSNWKKIKFKDPIKRKKKQKRQQKDWAVVGILMGLYFEFTQVTGKNLPSETKWKFEWEQKNCTLLK